MTAAANRPGDAGTVDARLPLRLKVAHGFGSIAYGVKDNGFSTFLLLYYNQVLGMDAKLVSLALMLALILDAFIDPVIGHLSDRTYTRWGRRLPWLYLAPIPLAFSWMLLWSPPGGDAPSFAYLVLVAMLVRTLVSACEVPSVALVPELTRDYDERSGLMRWRYLFGWAGGLGVMMLAYTVLLAPTDRYPDGILNPDGYTAYALVGAVLMACAVLLSALGQHRWAARWPDRRPPPLSIATAFDEIREALSHPAFLVLLAAGAIAFTSQGITFSISNYLYLYVWQMSGRDLQGYPLILFGSVIVCFLLVPVAHRRFGKKWTAVWSSSIGMVFWVAPFVLRAAGWWPTEGSSASTAGLFTLFFLSNVFSVMTMISGSSMIADIVEASEEQTGRRTEGVFFAGNFFMQKCATGLGIGLTGLLVDWAGMPEKAVPGQVDPAVIDRLSLTYCLIVAVAALSASWIFRRFPIDRADHEARVAALDARRTDGAAS